MLTFTLSVTEELPFREPQQVEKDIDWQVGEAPPSEYLDDATIQVLSVMAEGRELEHIIHEFINLPYTNRAGRSCVWRGDLARFIFDNL